MESRTLDIAFKRLRRRRSYNVRLDYLNCARGAKPRRCDLPDELWDLNLPPDPGRTTRRSPAGPLIGPPTRGADLETLKQTGRRLFDRVVGQKGEGVFHAQLASAVEHPEGRLRVRIDVGDDPSLFQVPWEMLYDDQQEWLATDVRTPVIRVLQTNKIVAPPRPAIPPLRMLVVIANAESDLDVFGEVTDIEKRIQAVRSTPEELVSIVDVLRTATLTELSEALAVHQPHILHYIGHGGFDDEGGFIHLHDEADPKRSTRLRAELMGRMIQADPPQLAVLNTCQGGTAATSNPFGGVAQSLIRQGVPTVVAMQFPISDEAAIVFSTALYGALGRGEPVDVAVNRGRHAILLRKSIGHELVTPVLYSADLASGHLIVSLPAPESRTSMPAPPAAEAPFARSGGGSGRPTGLTIGLATAAALGSAILLVAVWSQSRLGSGTAETSEWYPDAGVQSQVELGTSKALETPIDAVQIERAVRSTPFEPAGPRAAPVRAGATRPVRRPQPPSAPVEPVQPEPRYPPIIFEPPLSPAPGPDYAEFTLPLGAEGETVSTLDAVTQMYFRSRGEIRLANRSDDPRAAARIRDWLLGRGVPGSAIIIQDSSESASPRPWLEGGVDLIIAAPLPAPPADAALVFHVGTAELATASEPTLLEIVAAYQAAHNQDLSIRIIGRADPDASPEDRGALAKARAAAIGASLESRGVASERIAAGVEPEPGPVAAGLVVGARTESFVTGAPAIYFELGSATPDPEQAATLDRVSSWLLAHPRAALALKGHTSISGPEELNLDLSSRRAVAVAAAMIERGVPETAIVSVHAEGEAGGVEDPAARRVDLLIVPRP